MPVTSEAPPTRRSLLGASLLGSAASLLLGRGATAAAAPHPLTAAQEAHPPAAAGQEPYVTHGGMTTVGEVDHARNGFDPHALLADWDTGTPRQDPGGRMVREFTVTGEDKEIEVAPGVLFPAWTYIGP